MYHKAQITKNIKLIFQNLKIIVKLKKILPILQIQIQDRLSYQMEVSKKISFNKIDPSQVHQQLINKIIAQPYKKWPYKFKNLKMI